MQNNNDGLMAIFTPIIESAINTKMETMDVSNTIREQLAGITKTMSKTINVTLSNTGTTKKMGIVHKNFAKLLKVVASGENVLLYGGAGTGKTTGVIQCAEALGLQFRAVSFNNQTTKTDLIGFIDANGVYHPSPIIQAMINGDLIILDEFDSGDGGVIMSINSLIDNGFIDTPNGVVYAHEDFRVVACANTALNGATKTYNTRKKLDGATESRFAIMSWNIDFDMVKAYTDNDDWYFLVKDIMEAVEANLDDVLMSPRNFYSGARMLRNTDLSLEDICEMTLYKGLDTDSRQVITNVIEENKTCVANLNKAIEAKTVKPEPVEPEPEPVEPEPEPVEPEPEPVEPEPTTNVEPNGEW